MAAFVIAPNGSQADPRLANRSGEIRGTRAFVVGAGSRRYLFGSICRLRFGFSRSSNWLRVLVLLFLPSFSA